MQKSYKSLINLLVVTSALSLFGCGAKTGCSGERTQCFGVSNSIFKNKATQPNLSPDFNYIRLTMNGQVAWLAQGATDQWPSANTKVYYSADRSVFKWSNGRLISITTPEYNWRERMITPLNWSSTKPNQFIREVDTVDGMTAVQERRELRSSASPEHDSYVGDKSTLQWVHEYSVSKSAAMEDKPSYDSWYAFESNNMNEPVYGQHCISKNYCLSWQVWKTS